MNTDKKKILSQHFLIKIENLLTNIEEWSIKDAQLKEQNGNAVAHYQCVNKSKRKWSKQQATNLNCDCRWPFRVWWYIKKKKLVSLIPVNKKSYAIKRKDAVKGSKAEDNLCLPTMNRKFFKKHNSFWGNIK